MSSEEEDKAALAYAAISSHLSEIGTVSSHKSGDGGGRHSYIHYDGIGDDDEDDMMLDETEEYGMEYISRRKSGAFSPPAVSTLHTSTGTGTGTVEDGTPVRDTESFLSPKTQSASMLQTPGTGMSRNSVDASVGSGGKGVYRPYRPDPIATPATHQKIAFSQKSEKDDDGSGDNGINREEEKYETSHKEDENEYSYEYGYGGGQSEGLEEDVSYARNDMNDARLDGEYRPYHDALQSLLRSKDIITSAGGSIHSGTRMKETKDIFSQFLDHLHRASYRRSTQQEYGDNMDIMDINTDAATATMTFNLENSKSGILSEQEGNLWSLLCELLNSSAAKTDINSILSLLLWNTTSTVNTTQLHNLSLEGQGGNYFTNQRHQISSWIKSFVQANPHLDAAALTHLLSSFFQIEDSNDIDSNNNTQPPLPELIRRRQVILSWIESCHARRLMNSDASASLRVATSTGDRRVMWKNTLQYLQSQKTTASSSILRNYSNRNQNITKKSKIKEFHPDAPLLLLFASNQNNKTQSVSPLDGNDEAHETYLLSTCLSFLKAGRFHEALELCREYGQPYRAASWNGNAVFGFVDVTVNSTNEDDDGGDTMMEEETKKEKTVKKMVGNPHRSLWKRSMWKIGRSLHRHCSVSNNNSDTTTKNGNTSLIYEAAITSILADDTQTALANPILNSHYMDVLWVYFRGIQARFMEQVYHSHNDLLRQNYAKEVIKTEETIYPTTGMEFEKQEKEQLDCTAEMERMEEGMMYQLLQKRRERYADDYDGGLWRDGIGAFLTGFEEVQRFLDLATLRLLKLRDVVLGGTNEEKVFSMIKWELEEKDEILLRFVTHLLLFFDILLSDDDIDHSNGGLSSLAPYYSQFHNFILPKKEEILHFYVQHLTKQKILWHLVGFYSSLLPIDSMMEITKDFWESAVEEDRDRQMVLKHAREYFVEGLDIIILRQVVRSSMLSYPASKEEEEEAESATKFPSSWLRLPPPPLSKKYQKQQHLQDRIHRMEEKITRGDIRKMNSIHWLCYYPEHRADALVCSNMLLRKLILEHLEYADGGDHDVEDVKLYTAKVFHSRFLPSDIVEVALNGGGVATLDHEVEESTSCRLGKLFVEQSAIEYGALACYLDAHSAFEEWKDLISSLSPIVPVSPITKSSEGRHGDSKSSSITLEEEISNKMQRKIYVDKKKDIGQRVIKATETARQAYMDVLTYEGGWLDLTAFETDVSAEEMNIGEDEFKERLEEMSLLRSKCIPKSVFLLLNILDDTAKWMNEFVQDIVAKFGKEESSDILQRIHGRDMLEEATEEGGIDQASSPFLPETWSRMISLLTTTVASKEHCHSDCFDHDEIKYFLKFMADNAAQLMLYQENGSI